MLKLPGASRICSSCTVSGGGLEALWVGVASWPQNSYFICTFRKEKSSHMPHRDARRLARMSDSFQRQTQTHQKRSEKKRLYLHRYLHYLT